VEHKKARDIQRSTRRLETYRGAQEGYGHTEENKKARDIQRNTRRLGTYRGAQEG
jgi:hypothetical protein